MRVEKNKIALEAVRELLQLYPEQPVWRKRRSGDYYESVLKDADACRVGLVLGLRAADNPSKPVDGCRFALLRAPVGCQIGPHVDGTPRLKVHQIYMLQPALNGGTLFVEGVACPLEVGDVCEFDANKELHWVTRVEGRERLVLSVQMF